MRLAHNTTESLTLAVKGRHFIMDGQLSKAQKGKLVKSRRVYLFNDCMLYTSTHDGGRRETPIGVIFLKAVVLDCGDFKGGFRVQLLGSEKKW